MELRPVDEDRKIAQAICDDIHNGDNTSLNHWFSSHYSTIFVVKLLNTVRRNIKVSSATAPNCPAEELVLAYAYHELSTEDEKIVGDHVHECLDCLDMVLAARHAEEVSDDMADIPLPAWLIRVQFFLSPGFKGYIFIY